MARIAEMPLVEKVSISALGLLFSVPFLLPFHAPPLPSFWNEWLAVLLGLAACFILIRRRAWLNLSIPGAVLMPLLLGSLILFQLVTGKLVYPESGILALLYLVWAALLMVATRALVDSYGPRVLPTVLAMACLAGGILNALAGLVQHFEIQTLLDVLVSHNPNQSIYGNLGQRNHYSSQLSLALASLLFLAVTRRWGTVIFAIPACLLLYALALSASKSTWLYISLFSGLALYWHLKLKQQESARLLALSVALLFGFIAVQFLTSIFDPLVTSATRLATTTGNSMQVRLGLWQAAWEIFMQSPFSGAGLGEYGYRFFRILGEAPPGMFNKPEFGTLAFSNAHNIVLHMLAELGIFSLALWLLLAIYIIKLFRTSLSMGDWWLVSLLGIFLVHSMLEYPLWYGYFLGMFAVALSLGDRSVLSLRSHSLARLGPPVMTVVMLIGSGMLLLLFRDYSSVQKVYLWGLSAESHVEANEAHRKLQEVRRHILLAPYVDHIYAQSPVNPAKPNDWPLQLKLNTRLMQTWPAPKPSYRQAVLLGLTGQKHEAHAMLDTAMKVYPNHLPIFLQWAFASGLAELPALSTLLVRAEHQCLLVDACKSSHPTNQLESEQPQTTGEIN